MNGSSEEGGEGFFGRGVIGKAVQLSQQGGFMEGAGTHTMKTLHEGRPFTPGGQEAFRVDRFPQCPRHFSGHDGEVFGGLMLVIVCGTQFGLTDILRRRAEEAVQDPNLKSPTGIEILTLEQFPCDAEFTRERITEGAKEFGPLTAGKNLAPCAQEGLEHQPKDASMKRPGHAGIVAFARLDAGGGVEHRPAESRQKFAAVGADIAVMDGDGVDIVPLQKKYGRVADIAAFPGNSRVWVVMQQKPLIPDLPEFFRRSMVLPLIRAIEADGHG